ncbi:MAG: hypothetical protein AAF449_19045 [Myxococcota bacterium]
MSRVTDNKSKARPKKKGAVTAAVLGWVACTHLLPVLHVVAHDLPHHHVGQAIVYLFDVLKEHHHHHHGDSAHEHVHGHIDAQPTSAPERPDDGSKPSSFDSAAHGFLSLLAPVVPIAPAVLQWALPLPSLRRLAALVFVARPLQRARDPPAV